MPREFKYKYRTRRNNLQKPASHFKKFAGFFCISTVILVFTVYYFYVKDLESTNTIKNLQQQILLNLELIQNQSRNIDNLNADINSKKILISELTNKLGIAQSEVQTLTPTIKTYYAAAVSIEGGIIIPFEVKLTNGTGLISVDIKNVELLGDVQDSVRTAVLVASDYTGVDFSKKDVTVSFINEQRELVSMDGPSAGAVITTSIIAATENRTINTEILATGTINPNGRIGRVGGVEEKALAAANFGADIFLVPIGEKIPIGGIEVVEVTHIQEIVNLVLD